MGRYHCPFCNGLQRVVISVTQQCGDGDLGAKHSWRLPSPFGNWAGVSRYFGKSYFLLLKLHRSKYEDTKLRAGMASSEHSAGDGDARLDKLEREGKVSTSKLVMRAE